LLRHSRHAATPRAWNLFALGVQLLGVELGLNGEQIPMPAHLEFSHLKFNTESYSLRVQTDLHSHSGTWRPWSSWSSISGSTRPISVPKAWFFFEEEDRRKSELSLQLVMQFL
jgi:hypothetical protein